MEVPEKPDFQDIRLRMLIDEVRAKAANSELVQVLCELSEQVAHWRLHPDDPVTGKDLCLLAILTTRAIAASRPESTSGSASDSPPQPE